MKIFSPMVVLVAALILSACSSGGSGGLFADRSGPENTVDVTQLPSMRVVGFLVEVPDSLVVSEANSYKPVADIVWREDPFGDRREQVKVIFEDALAQGVSDLQGNLAVVVHIQVRQFHALTERTRYSIGGIHAIDFLLSITNGRTGEEIVPAYLVSTDLRAFGGEEALAAERIGQTQKVRITTHLAALIRQQLTGAPAQPAG